jgi:phenylalanyl-tRNA synthetase beta chain
MSIIALRTTSAQPHPNADRLRVYQFEGGPDGELIQIVANTDNVYQVGDVVACALIGTVLEDGTEIQKGKFRGERSFGMALGKTDQPVGTDLTAAFNATDISKAIDESNGVIEDSAWMRYTSLEGYLKLRADILACDEVIVTEKSHGSNFRVGFRGTMGYLVGTHTSRILPSRMDPTTWPKGHLITHALEWCSRLELKERVQRWKAAHPSVTQMAIYGELMGFKCSDLHYGETGQRVRLFGEAQVDGRFLSYDDAYKLISEMFTDQTMESLLIPVLYRGKPDPAILKELRDRPSTLAAANGVEQISEGIVIRANPEAFSAISKDRLIAKWKGPLYAERKSLRNRDPSDLPTYITAYDLIFDFVTEERIKHVWQRAMSRGVALDMRHVNDIAQGLLDDILKESVGEWPAGTSPEQMDQQVLLRWTKNIAADMIAMVMQDIQVGMTSV